MSEGTSPAEWDKGLAPRPPPAHRLASPTSPPWGSVPRSLFSPHSTSFISSSLGTLMSPMSDVPKSTFPDELSLPDVRSVPPHTTDLCRTESCVHHLCCVTNTPELSDPRERLIISHDSAGQDFGPDSSGWFLGFTGCALGPPQGCIPHRAWLAQERGGRLFSRVWEALAAIPGLL